MSKLDCLFLHPSTTMRVRQRGSPQVEDRIRNVIMPMGTIAIADLLEREGYSVKIIHTGLERMLDHSFSVDKILEKYDATVVGIDLHWYAHGYDAIQIADISRETTPNAFVVLGGFTASFFAEEILEHSNSVDAVIRGDAEIPILELMRQISTHKLENVPNLLYRDGKSIKQSKNRYIASTQDLNDLCYSNLPLMENWHNYIKLTSENDALQPKLKTQGWVCIGRGCTANCSYCGGGSNAYKIISGRESPIFRSTEKVLETISRFEEMKISCLYIDFDPYPSNRNYYLELFDKIRREKIDIGAQFLLWSLSDSSLLKEFKKTFNPLFSTITLSPESGSEKIRKINRSFFYDNAQFFHWLDHAKEETVPIELYFTSGLSEETYEDFKQTLMFCYKIKEKYPMVINMVCNPIVLEPVSPRFLHPSQWGITLTMPTWRDFYVTYKKFAFGVSVLSRLGYQTKDLPEGEIIELSKIFNENFG